MGENRQITVTRMTAHMGRVVNIADLRDVAKRRLPRVVFDYIDGGADAEWTLRENSRVFDDVMFRPRSAVATTSFHFFSRRWAARGFFIRVAKKLPRVWQAMPARSIRFRRCRAAPSAMSRRRRADRCGISSISSEAAMWRPPALSARKAPAVPR